MNEVKLVSTKQVLGKELNIYGSIDEPLFLAKDVAEWIEHKNITHMMNTVDVDEKLTYTICNSGQGREMWFLTEDGLYEVLMQSRKPIAKQFKKEVKRILKELRKGELYSIFEEDARERNRQIMRLENYNKMQTQKIEELGNTVIGIRKDLCDLASEINYNINYDSPNEFSFNRLQNYLFECYNLKVSYTDIINYLICYKYITYDKEYNYYIINNKEVKSIFPYMSFSQDLFCKIANFFIYKKFAIVFDIEGWLSNKMTYMEYREIIKREKKEREEKNRANPLIYRNK